MLVTWIRETQFYFLCKYKVTLNGKVIVDSVVIFNNQLNQVASCRSAFKDILSYNLPI